VCHLGAFMALCVLTLTPVTTARAMTALKVMLPSPVLVRTIHIIDSVCKHLPTGTFV